MSGTVFNNCSPAAWDKWYLEVVALGPGDGAEKLCHDQAKRHLREAARLRAVFTLIAYISPLVQQHLDETECRNRVRQLNLVAPVVQHPDDEHHVHLRLELGQLPPQAFIRQLLLRQLPFRGYWVGQPRGGAVTALERRAALAVLDRDTYRVL